MYFVYVSMLLLEMDTYLVSLFFQVLVMTPQILLNALRKTYLSFEVFCFIVLDECHRATGNHPYARIMKVNFILFCI